MQSINIQLPVKPISIHYRTNRLCSNAVLIIICLFLSPFSAVGSHMILLKAHKILSSTRNSWVRVFSEIRMITKPLGILIKTESRLYRNQRQRYSQTIANICMESRDLLGTAQNIKTAHYVNSPRTGVRERYS